MRVRQMHHSYLALLHGDVADQAADAARTALPATDDPSTPSGGAGPLGSESFPSSSGRGALSGRGWLRALWGGGRPLKKAQEAAEPPLLYALDKMFSNTWWVLLFVLILVLSAESC